MFLHGDGKFETYLSFFSHLYGAMSSDILTTQIRTNDTLLTGSDDEKAMVKALEIAFPKSKHIYCTLHIKENVRQRMISIGVSDNKRKALVDMLFGPDGLSLAANEQELDDRITLLMQYARQSDLPLQVPDYLQQRIIPKLVNNCTLMWHESWLSKLLWSNNNCESANHLLKMKTDWKPARILDLVNHLHELVRLQYADLRRALYGHGNYELRPPFTRHRVQHSVWLQATEARKQLMFESFLSDTGSKLTRSKVTTSKDGKLTVTSGKGVAKKNGQRKRPKSERSGPKHA
jgi:hypothetical protein